ncbi:MAG: hypothetical protein AAF290_03230 [Pseudomonadota bacterium]
MLKIRLLLVFSLVLLSACTLTHRGGKEVNTQDWLLVDNFESGLNAWTHLDVDNQTDPFVPNPQVAEIQSDEPLGNQFLLRKPAADGVVGNRKAIGFRPLPVAIEIGETYTLYTRINVEYFPNNHSFGLSNATDIGELGYDAFEPMIRVTDKPESNGYKNPGTLQVLGGGNTRYAEILHPATGLPASPLIPGEWYEVWYVIDNSVPADGGQTYDLYIRGGEFQQQQKVFTGAVFRLQRTQPLTSFMTICNTGPKKAPYGNGGVRYDDIYMSEGINLASPLD